MNWVEFYFKLKIFDVIMCFVIALILGTIITINWLKNRKEKRK